MQLYNHQQELVDLLPKKHLLAWECRTGKSFATIACADKIGSKILVVCPKGIKDQWIEYINEFSERPDDYRVLTKEEFKKLHDKLPYYNFIAIDEGHNFSGLKSGLYKSMISYLKKYNPDSVYILTATPYRSTPWNIYALAKILGRDWNWMAFKREFFYDINMGGRKIPKIKDNIEPKIAKLVQNLGSIVKMQDCVDMPEQIFEIEYFELTPEQKKAIEEIKMTESTHITKWTAIHQVCGGTRKGDGYIDDQFFKNEKIQRLKELASEHKKLVVVCRYNNEIDYITRELKEYNVKIIRGDVKDRHQVVNEANSSEQCIVLVNAACSEGYTLATFHIMVFYSYSFSLTDYIQMIGRIQSINHLDKKLYLSLIVKGTIDEDVFKCIGKKQDFDIAIYNK